MAADILASEFPERAFIGSNTLIDHHLKLQRIKVRKVHHHRTHNRNKLGNLGGSKKD